MPPLGAKKHGTAVGGDQWVDRHRPKHLGQVVGNTDLVRKLAEWLRDWDDVVFRGMTKEQPAVEEWRTYKQVAENLTARAALVSGPAGIGKTTTATLVARCNPKYSVMEFNASDARSKAVIESMSTSLAGNHKLNLGSKKSTLQRTVIIMDECDGMTAGDKGGMQALINMIKVTKNPIICICNERGDQHVKNLAPHCLDIKFRRPDNIAVAKRVKGIMAGEGKKVDLEAVESIVEACGHDIRQVINHVQFFGSTAVGRSKDAQVMLSPFDACSRLLSGAQGKAPLPLEQRMDMFYIDSDMVPLMIQENYLRPFEKANEEDTLAACAEAATLIAVADGMGGSFQMGNSAAVMGSIYPAFLAANATKEPFQRPAFPTWLMKRGATSKAERQALDMHSGLKVHTTCSYRDLVTSGYHDVLHRRLLRPLQLGAVKECADALYSYGLTREFFTDQAPALRTPLQLDDRYKNVDGRFKHQLLQELQALSQQNAPVKRKRDDVGAVAKRKEHLQQEGGTVAHDDSLADAETCDDAAAARKRRARKTSKADDNNAAASLAGWLPKKEVVSGSGEANARKEPMVHFRYLDGHTNAVRRKVRMADFQGPWTMF